MERLEAEFESYTRLGMPVWNKEFTIHKIRSLIQGPLADISLDMPKGPKNIGFSVHHIILGLWNQKLQNFLRAT